MTKKETLYRDELLKYIDKVKKLGYKVYFKNRDDDNYGWITDGINICSCDLGEYGEGFYLGSVSKTGNRFNMCPDCKCLYEITKDNIIYAFGNYPIWANEEDKRKVTKYKNWDEFISKHWDKENIIEY